MGVTLADVTRAADQIIAEGERPTLDSVRRILGAGSPGTVNTLCAVHRRHPWARCSRRRYGPWRPWKKCLSTLESSEGAVH